MHKSNPKETARLMIDAALLAVNPYDLIHKQLKIREGKLIFSDQLIDLDSFERIFILGAGKAAAPMAKALEEIIGDYLFEGAVVVKYDHTAVLKKIKLFEAAHPVPDKNTLNATSKLVQIANNAGKNDLVFFLLSGGGSALFELLPETIKLDDLKKLNQELLGCGASIEEINVVRKHISLVKGGRFAEMIAPAQCQTLILSDIIDDPLESIASGPTAPDPSSFSDAFTIIERYKLGSKIPESILNHFQNSLDGKIQDTLTKDSRIFKKVNNLVIGNNMLAINALAQAAESAGYQVDILTDALEGEAREIAKFWAAIIKHRIKQKTDQAIPICLIAGGEPTVTLKGKGKGGRNQELVLAVLNQLNHIEEPFYFSSIGTDGTDGPTDAAGAWIDEKSASRAKSVNRDIQIALDQNDAYPFFDAINGLVTTGPTGTNVMDVMFCLI